MNSKELLIFDIRGEYGHFRKYNTTTSPLTYSIPTRTAIAGILGAILAIPVTAVLRALMFRYVWMRGKDISQFSGTGSGETAPSSTEPASGSEGK